MAGKPQHLTLTPEQDEQLRRIEHSPHIKPKVRLRAQVIRLNAAGWSRRHIAQHTRRTYGTICQDLRRWRERGLDGLADAPATNQPEKITPDIRSFVLERLQEERTWTCTQLLEAVEEHFGVRAGREASGCASRGSGTAGSAPATCPASRSTQRPCGSTKPASRP